MCTSTNAHCYPPSEQQHFLPSAGANPQGKEYSCYTLAHEGRIVAHADTAASLSNLNYASQDHPGIWDWVHTFVTRSGVSGQVGV
jgi:hypothetical protein